MDFVEFVAGTASNILGELIGGTLGEKVTDFLFNKVTDAVSKNKAYKKYIDSGEGTSGQRFKTFFDDLNTEINGRHSADKRAYKKAKTTQKRAQLLLSEFCLYTGITADGIRQELEAYVTYNAQDEDFKRAIVAVLFDMRKYYAELKLSEDNKALITLLCSVIEDKSEENAEQIAKRVVAQLADRITLTGVAPTVENGAKIVVKGITLTRLECPDCGKGILEELRSSSDKMFTCSNCGSEFAFGDFSNDLKEEITDKLDNAIEYLDAIYSEVKSIKKAIEEQGKKFESLAVKTVEETYEKTKSLIEKNSGISAEELSRTLTDSTSEIINGIKEAFTADFSELKSNQKEQKESIKNILEILNTISQNTETIVVNVNNLICEVESEYPSAERINVWANKIKEITTKNYIANFCYNAVVAGSSCRNLYKNYITNVSQNDVNEYGAHIAQLLIRTPKYFDGIKLCEYVEKIDNASKRKALLQAIEEEKEKNSDPNIYNINAKRHIFIVYAHEDLDKAKSLASFLEKEKNLKCFYAKRNLNNGLGSGDNYASDLMTAMDNCRCVVFISTKYSRRLDHDTVYNLDKDFPKGCGYTGSWGELRYIDLKSKNGTPVPRIEYRPDDREVSNDEEADRFVTDFFEGTGRYCNSFEMVYERYKSLIINGEWDKTHSNSLRPVDPPLPIPPVTSGGKTEAEFVNSWYCVENLHENMPGAKVCAYCDCEQFYTKYDEYKNVYCSECLAPANRGAINCSACKAKRVKFINYFEMQQERTARKITSLMQEADSAFNKKAYEAAINLYSQAAELGNEEAKNKKTLAEQKAEAERKRREEKKRNAILNIGDYKDIGGGYVIFGTYPQSKKADNVKIGEIFDKERGYYLGSDDCMYAKYNLEYYKVEPIKWKVLQRSGEIFVVADDILDAHRFAASYNNYAYSDVRKFINGDFYSEAFNDSQKAKIITTTIDNSLSSTGNSSNKYTCGNTSDEVFLLSNGEAGQYIAGDEARKRVPTDYAVARGARQSSNYKRNGKGCGWWWLRSPAFVNRRNAQGVYSDGSFYSSDVSSTYGVVPALKIKP